jgi:hypothetical protein
MARSVQLLGGYVAPKDIGTRDGLASAEIYDPATGTFTATGSMNGRRVRPTTTLLPDGDLLVSGGAHGAEGYAADTGLELYDPTSGKFSSAGLLGQARSLHAASHLPSGVVLFVGGYQGTGAYGSYLASTDAFSPSTGTCIIGPALTDQRAYHTATVLRDGGLLVVGGFGGKVLASAEIYRQ